MWTKNQITHFAKSYESIISSFYAQTSLQMTIHRTTKDCNIEKVQQLTNKDSILVNSRFAMLVIQKNKKIRQEYIKIQFQ